MISRVIEWCAHNRFLVFTGVLLLTLTGIWSMGHIPLDALPDISDVEVIIHTNWEGEPPSIIEDQVSSKTVSSVSNDSSASASCRLNASLKRSITIRVEPTGDDLSC